ncbi:ATP-dependent RNA helicase DEAH11, chloroplastic-like [Typha latifolia]|uniref:ATP-dependent RNA helicase DEAH11, chloroplastic-like n=1 Tax=Typha latifolia TaxID=4733 RepID=UPI003C2D9DD0
MRKGYSHYDRRPTRPLRPPDQRPLPNINLWQPRPKSKPSFVVLLLRPKSTAKPLSSSDIKSLIASCPSPPEEYSIPSSGRLAAMLFFHRKSDAIDDFVFLWSRRLDGDHPMTPRLEPSDLAEDGSRVRALFSRHVGRLLESDTVRQCEEMIHKVGVEIKKVSQLLQQRNRLVKFGELQDRKNRLEMEREQMECKLEEFRAAMECLLARLRKERGKKEMEKVEIFNLGHELDYGRIHGLMMRECRRLEDGLPIYACRRKILNHIFSNQAIVLVGETGSGKSTQLVQFLADSGLTADGSIVCTQPRKIAAMSLAERVGEEGNECYADDFVMSYPTYSSSQEFRSRIVFMTDHCLLQHCINGMGLAGISCIVVDEAHERSLNTDLLMALIKKKLIESLDLRLIIMSATADASKLADYFYGCRTFHVMGRTFPVEIKYIPSISEDPSFCTILKQISGNYTSYVCDVIRMVRIIHKIEEDGSILAFLTSQAEVEWACENFTDPAAVVLPMHGKLSSIEQSRVFKNYPGKRKVIFSTNIAETSLTIQGVKYVVDSGMVKESRFEPSNGMNILKVNWISQSSANQRAGRAGRTEAGKCYRLYSECDFHSMERHQEPEIRKVHLGTAVLRILALGIRKTEDFEFVDAPSPKAIDMAIHNLVQLGAVTHQDDEFELTNTGRSLVKLGVEPRLGKIILDCFSYGLRKEGLVLAAVMANASSIFCRVGSDEDKYKADSLRVSFCHKDGDIFTLLSVYKKWEEEHDSRSKWCWQNSINAKSMKRCQETVMELENCLKHELNIIIPSYWLWDPDEPTLHDKSLKRILLTSLADNLAMFSGCDRLGYQVALTGQNVQLHPSSSLLVYSNKPNWVVFREILSIPNQYLVCVTAVNYDDFYMIQPPLFDVQQLESQKMQMKVITGAGNSLLRRFCGKSNQNLRRILSHIKKVCMDDRIVVDIDFDHGEIQVFATAKDMEKVSSTVSDALECEARWLRDECVEKSLFPGRPGSSPTIALFGSGAEIKHLELEKRYLTVEIIHPNHHALDDKELIFMVDQRVSGIVNVHKHVGTDREGADASKWGKITFLRPENAENAVAMLNEEEYHGSILKVLPVCTDDHRVLPFPAVRVKVSWPRRPSRGIALITCDKGEAEFIVRDCSNLEIGGRYIKCEVSTKYENCVFVRGLSKNVSETELCDAFHHATNRRILDIHLLRGLLGITDPSITTCREALVKEISAFMPNKKFPDQNFRVEVFKPEVRDYMMKASITFNGSLHLEAAKALDHLQGRVLPGCLPWQTIQCQNVFHSSVSCPSRVYFVISQQLDSLLQYFRRQKGVSYNLENNEYGSFRVKISANATKTIADLRKPLEQLMKGKTVRHPNLTPTMMQLHLSHDGIRHLKDIERETGTYILYDRQSLNFKVFGPPGQVSVAEEKLVQTLLFLNEKKLLEIRLRGRNLPPDLMKEVVRRFGPDLHGLKEKVPEVECTLNTRRHILYVRGSKEQKQTVEELISEVAISIDHTGLVEQTSEGSCPICLCELEEPYRLETCGHNFCRACLVDQCESAIRSRDGFPLCCVKDGCKKLIFLVDLRSLLLSEKLEELFRASLGAFVASSGGTYRFCPTPDCPSVYRIASPDAEVGPFVCGACTVETCTKCHLEYHPFISCERYKEYKEDPDQSLLEWRHGKENVKNCLSCGYTIEKSDGCNHIECKCGTHICWVCLNIFRSSDECYTHLRSVHQSY